MFLVVCDRSDIGCKTAGISPSSPHLQQKRRQWTFGSRAKGPACTLPNSYDDEVVVSEPSCWRQKIVVAEARDRIGGRLWMSTMAEQLLFLMTLSVPARRSKELIKANRKAAVTDDERIISFEVFDNDGCLD
jgi:hypothetical protein